MKKCTKRLCVFLLACMSVFAVNAQNAIFNGAFDNSLSGQEVVFAELTYTSTGGNPNLYFGLNGTGITGGAWNIYAPGFNMNTANLEIRPRTGDNADAANGSNVSTGVYAVEGEKFQVWFALDVPSKTYSFKVKTKANEFISYANNTPAYEYAFRNKTTPLTHYIAAGTGGSLTKHIVAVVSAVDDLPADYVNDATLEGISFGDVIPVSSFDFDPGTDIYNVVLPKGTTSVNVSAVTSRGLASIFSGIGAVDVSSGSGTTTILVKSQDETVQKSYTLNFTVESKSSDATLSDLQVNGTTIPGFSAAQTEYTYYAAPGAVPTVTAAKNNPDASDPDVTPAAQLPGATTVYVKAEDDIAELTYTINFIINYMAGWDGNGKGSVNDKPDDFGWYCADQTITWNIADDATNNYLYRYRDNLSVGRIITHPVNDAVFSFPIQDLEENKLYRFTCKASNIYNNISTTFGINTANDNSGTILNSQTKNVGANPWDNGIVDFSFEFTPTTSGTHYLTWQTTNGAERNFAWDFMIVEILEPKLNVSKKSLGLNKYLTEQLFTIQAVNLENNITLTAPEGITLKINDMATTTISKEDAALATGITITASYNGTASIAGNITITSEIEDGDDLTHSIAINTDNLIAGWDGYGMTGADTEPDKFGWGGATDFGVAGSAGTFYRDNLGSANGKRVLLRPIGGQLYFPAQLEGGKVYRFTGISLKINQPTNNSFEINAAINRAEGTRLGIVTKNSPQDVNVVSELDFVIQTDGTYYLHWYNDNTGNDRHTCHSLSIVEIGDAEITWQGSGSDNSWEENNWNGKVCDLSTYIIPTSVIPQLSKDESIPNLKMEDGTQIDLNSYALTITGKFIAEKTIAYNKTNKYWSPIGLPFTAKAYRQDTDVELSPATDYWLKYYDGAANKFEEKTTGGLDEYIGYNVLLPSTYTAANPVKFIGEGASVTDKTSAVYDDGKKGYQLVANPTLADFPIQDGGGYYFYKYNPATNNYARINTPTTIVPFEAFIMVYNEAPSPVLRSFFSVEETGEITSLQFTDDANDPVVEKRYYTLQGVEIDVPANNGFYIIRNIHESGKETIKKVILNELPLKIGNNVIDLFQHITIQLM